MVDGSVRRFAGQITDPVLKKRVAGFIGQEAMHGQEHRRLNEKLYELGYHLEWMDPQGAWRDRIIEWERRFPQLVHLAGTAAAEHYTAILAQRVLSSAEIQALVGDPEVRRLLNWHAFEELEHKSVAFDVYRAMGGSEATRILVMALLSSLAVPLALVHLTVSIGQDPIARTKPLAVAHQTRTLFRGPILKGLLPELAQYLKPGFHPDDIDSAALLARWQRELFGADIAGLR